MRAYLKRRARCPRTARRMLARLWSYLDGHVAPAALAVVVDGGHAEPEATAAYQAVDREHRLGRNSGVLP